MFDAHVAARILITIPRCDHLDRPLSHFHLSWSHVMTRLLLVCLLWFAVAMVLHPLVDASADERARLLVLTDIGGDPDDQQSMIRLMSWCVASKK